MTPPVHWRYPPFTEAEPEWVRRHVRHWNETGTCLRHFSIDYPPLFCEQCGKPWTAVMDGRVGRRNRRLRQTAPSSKNAGREEGIPGGLLEQARRDGLM